MECREAKTAISLVGVSGAPIQTGDYPGFCPSALHRHRRRRDLSEGFMLPVCESLGRNSCYRPTPTSFTALITRGGQILPCRPGRIEASALAVVWSSGIGFDSQSVVHGNPELLLASEVALRRLDGDVAEQELDLIQFATREVAETGAGAPQVVRRQLVDAGASRSGADDIPEHLRRTCRLPRRGRPC